MNENSKYVEKNKIRWGIWKRKCKEEKEIRKP